MKFKSTLLAFLLSITSMVALAQSPVHFSVQQKQTAPDELVVTFSGTIAPGWHVYSTGLPADGPTSATLTTEVAEGVKANGKLTPKGKEISKHDNLFGMNLRYFENSVTFVQKYKITGKTYKVKGFLEYGACNDESCMPPSTVEFSHSGNGPADAPEAKDEKAKDETAKDSVPAAAAADSIVADSAQADTTTMVAQGDLWKPVIDQLKAFDGGSDAGAHSLWYILVMGFLGGLLAVLMPCIWPIIPMTVSFFLKRTKDKSKGIRDAITYGISIIVIYLALGLIATAISGGNGLNSLPRSTRCLPTPCSTSSCSSSWWYSPFPSSDGSSLNCLRSGPTPSTTRLPLPADSFPSSSWRSPSCWLASPAQRPSSACCSPRCQPPAAMQLRQ